MLTPSARRCGRRERADRARETVRPCCAICSAITTALPVGQIGHAAGRARQAFGRARAGLGTPFDGKPLCHRDRHCARRICIVDRGRLCRGRQGVHRISAPHGRRTGRPFCRSTPSARRRSERADLTANAAAAARRTRWCSLMRHTAQSCAACSRARSCARIWMRRWRSRVRTDTASASSPSTARSSSRAAR